MAIEYPQSDLETLITADLARYSIGQELGEWVARDRAVDELIRAPDRETLIRKIACASDRLDLTDRPRIHGVPVLVAEVHGDRDTFEWFAIDANGKKHVNNRVHPTRDTALMALNDRYDD